MSLNEAYSQAAIYYIIYLESKGSNPFVPAFAPGGSSGLSYGYTQNDIKNKNAELAFRKILSESGVSPEMINTIVAEGKKPGVASLKTPAETQIVTNALQTNQSEVIAQDIANANLRLNSLNHLLNFFSTYSGGYGVLNPQSPNLTAIALVSAWLNQFGPAYTDITNYFKTSNAPVTLANLELAISDNIYFTDSRPVSEFDGIGEGSLVWHNFISRINSAVSADNLTIYTISSGGTLNLNSQLSNIIYIQQNGSISIYSQNGNALSQNSLEIFNQNGLKVGVIPAGTYSSISISNAKIAISTSFGVGNQSSGELDVDINSGILSYSTNGQAQASSGRVVFSIEQSQNSYTINSSDIDQSNGISSTMWTYFNLTGSSGSGSSQLLINFDQDEYPYGSVETTKSSENSEAITNYSYAGQDGQGQSQLLSLEYSVQPMDTFNSVALTFSLGPYGGSVLAAINGQLDASATINEPEIYVPFSDGPTQSLAFDGNATVSEAGTGYDMTTETWTFSTGGILTLSGGTADGGSFTPLTMEGTQDPGNAVYILNAAGVLIDILLNANGVSIGETVQNNPGSTSKGVTTPPSVIVSYYVSADFGSLIQSGDYYVTHPVGNNNNFGPANSHFGLPFFPEDGGTTTTAGADFSSAVVGNGAEGVATFNSASDTPDATWDIGANAAGDAVFTGLDGSGYSGTATLTQGENGTAIVDGVSLGQSVYGLVVIPDSGVSGTINGLLPSASQNIFAEGTGTTNITLGAPGTAYWHINGLNDTFTLTGPNNEFYMAGPSSSYTLAWNGNGTLAITGGSTGITTFNIQAAGGGDVNFSNGISIGLGSNDLTGNEDNLLFGGQLGVNDFILDGGNQTVYGAGITNLVQFDAGSDDPADWTITESAVSGQPIAVTFDGTDAGYDGVAVLSNVQQVELNDITYQLDAVALGGTQTITKAPSIVVDVGNAALTFDDTSDFNTGNWFVGGANDTATLLAGTTEIYLAGDESDYSLNYTAQDQLQVTGGTTGTTTIDLAGGTGEVVFGDGTAIGLGGIEDEVQYAGSGTVELTVEVGETAYGGSGADTFNVNGGQATGGSGPNIFVVSGGEAIGGAGSNSFMLNGNATAIGGAGDNQFLINTSSSVIIGGTGHNTVDLEPAYYSPTEAFSYTEDNSGNVTASGFGVTATLTNVQEVFYQELTTLPVGGGDTTITTPTDGALEGLVVEYAGSTNNVDFESTQLTTWHLTGSGDTVQLDAGIADIYMPGNQTDYILSSDGTTNLILTDTVTNRNGTTTFDAGADGLGSIFFADGSFINISGVACFCSDTLILTEVGEIPVDRLRIGDQVITVSGQGRPILWMGRRSYAQRFAQTNPALWPIRFLAGSLGDGLPRRDLLVSGEHAMLLDGLLIPARHLTNGITITRERPQADLFYFHIELETHDAILAEGAASETFLDDDSRGMFHNAAEFRALYPNAVNDGCFCAPRVEHGYELEAVRQRLKVVAEASLQAA